MLIHRPIQGYAHIDHGDATWLKNFESSFFVGIRHKQYPDSLSRCSLSRNFHSFSCLIFSLYSFFTEGACSILCDVIISRFYQRQQTFLKKSCCLATTRLNLASSAIHLSSEKRASLRSKTLETLFLHYYLQNKNSAVSGPSLSYNFLFFLHYQNEGGRCVIVLD